MEVSKDDIAKMLLFINSTMQADKDYPISEKAKECILTLLRERRVNNLFIKEKGTLFCKTVQELTNAQLNKMYGWVINSMQTDKWYTIESASHLQCFLHLFDEGLIDYCTLSNDFSKIRKTNLNYLHTPLYKSKTE